MKKTCALLVGLAIVSGVSPADAAKKAEASAVPPSLEEVNRALAGRSATIKLFEGKAVRRAKSVRVESDFVRWDSGNGTEQVLTSEVAQVSLRGRFPILRGVAMGLAAGTLIGIVAGGSTEETGTSLDAAAGAAAMGASILGGAAIGGVVGATRGKRGGSVVYEAPFDRYPNETPSRPPGDEGPTT